MQHLGEDLIPNDRVALVELVKNAYDADANTVVVRFMQTDDGSLSTIEVWDDGHGMSVHTVETVWMEIATPSRSKNRRSESGARRVLGAKGLGRFSVARLAKELVLETRRADLDEVVLETNWDDYTSDDLYLDDLQITWEERSAATFAPGGPATEVFREAFQSAQIDESPPEVEHGTVLRLVGPRSDWSETEVDALRNALSRLTPPPPPADLDVPDRPEFRILLVDATGVATAIGPNPTIESPVYRLSGEVRADGSAELYFTSTYPGEDETFTTNLREGSRRLSCGPLKFDLRVWDLDRDGLTQFLSAASGMRRIKDVRELIRQNSGVSLYRDAFRVQPYGDPEVDWLGLDQRRVNNPTMRLSNNQIVGFVYITADENKDLRDQANRQGLISNEQFEDLQSVVTTALDLVEARRYSLRRGLDTAAGRRDRAKSVFDAFNLSDLRDVVSSRFPDDDALSQAVDEAEQNLKDGVKEVQEVIARFSRLATLGSLVDVITHEGNTALAIQNFALDDVEDLLADNEGECADQGRDLRDRIVAASQTLGRLFDGLEPLGGRRRGRPRRLSLQTVVRSAVELVSGELRDSEVTVEILGEDSIVTADESDIYQIVVNLVRNAAHWTVVANAAGKRHVQVETSRGDGWVAIEVADNGPGVPAENAPFVFDAYFSTREGGTGLGLNIAGSIVQDFYGGSLELVPSTDDLPGARFRATLRKRIG